MTTECLCEGQLICVESHPVHVCIYISHVCVHAKCERAYVCVHSYHAPRVYTAALLMADTLAA